MSEAVAEADDRPAATGQDRLPRKLSAPTMALIFIAFTCPLAAAAGFMQLVIAFGNGIGAPLAFLVAGAFFLVFQVGCLSMGKHMKSPGAFYCYIAEGLGKPPALAGAFLAFLAYVMLSVSSVVYLGLITENLMKQLFGNTILPWQIWAAIGLALITILNLLRVDLSIKVIAILIATETVIVAIWQAAVLIKGGPEGYSPASFSPTTFLNGNVGVAVLFALCTLIGLESMAVFREEARDPEKTIPRAAYSSVAFMSILLSIACWTYIVAIGPSKVVDDARNVPVDSFFHTMQIYIGGFVPTLVSILLVTSQMAAANAVQAAASRYAYTLGKDNVLPAVLGKVHSRLGSPYVAALVTAGLVAVIFVAVITFSTDVVLVYGALAGLGTVCVLALILGTCAAVIVFFRKNRGLEGVWKSTIAPVVAFLGLAAVLYSALTHLDILAGSTAGAVASAVLLALTVLAGILVALWLKRRRPQIYQRIGRQEI